PVSLVCADSIHVDGPAGDGHAGNRRVEPVNAGEVSCLIPYVAHIQDGAAEQGALHTEVPLLVILREHIQIGQRKGWRTVCYCTSSRVAQKRLVHGYGLAKRRIPS